MRACRFSIALATAVLTLMRRAVTSTFTVRPSAVAPPVPVAVTLALPEVVKRAIAAHASLRVGDRVRYGGVGGDAAQGNIRRRAAGATLAVASSLYCTRTVSVPAFTVAPPSSSWARKLASARAMVCISATLRSVTVVPLSTSGHGAHRAERFDGESAGDVQHAGRNPGNARLRVARGGRVGAHTAQLQSDVRPAGCAH